MKKRKILLLCSAIFLGGLPLTSCGETPSTTSEVESPYKIGITAIGSTTIKVSNTIQLRSSVSGTTQKDVTWTSSDENIASVSKNGLVKGLSQGEVTITATLNIDSNCKASIKIIVEQALTPSKIIINGSDSEIQWVGEDLLLTVDTEPSEASKLVTWSSSNEQVASVNQEGLVSFLSKGEVTITATSKEDNNIFSSVHYNVKQGVFRSDLGSPYWDLSHQADDTNAKILINQDTPAGYHSAYFSHVLSTKYYVEFDFKITKQLSNWVWQGVGIGSGLSESDTRYFLFSPKVEGQGNGFNKTIVKDLPNESWPAITTRSQVWGENGLNEIRWESNTVKLGMLRNENEHYYLINDRVMWYDNSTKYEDVPTMPILCAIDVACEVSNYTVITDENEINQKLNNNEYKKSFYSCNSEIVNYNDDSDFSFNANTVLSKDHKVRSLGDKAKLVGDFEVEFDVSDLVLNKAHTSGFTGMTCNFSRYDQADTCESFMIGKSALQTNDLYVGRYASWNYQRSMDDPDSMYSYLETSASVASDLETTHHVKITRTIKDNIATFKMFIDNKECEFDFKSSTNATMTSRYTGAYLIWVGGEYTSGAIKNFVFNSSIK